ncbi:MAG: C_GCAxxG_C_C family protein [Deltaproteobacteria bacterium]|nr:C_GCAxxG_C_C family protein [Deltaproteobacteria bacterium]
MDENAVKRSDELFGSGKLYCGESVLQAVAESRGIHSDLIPRIATGFCSGLARTCGTCGAVSGAVMALGLALGRDAPDDPPERAYAAVREFLEIFEGQFGSTNCRALTGCDLGTGQGLAFFRDNNLIERCRRFTVEATRIVLEVIERQGESLA